MAFISRRLLPHTNAKGSYTILAGSSDNRKRGIMSTKTLCDVCFGQDNLTVDAVLVVKANLTKIGSQLRQQYDVPVSTDLCEKHAHLLLGLFDNEHGDLKNRMLNSAVIEQ